LARRATTFTRVATVADLLREIRDICLGFPEAVEKETWDQPTFRVRGKIFAIVGEVDPADDDRGAMLDRGGSPAVVRISMKAPPGDQELLLAEGDPFFLPPYVGPRGWIGIVVGETTDFSEIAELIEDSYRLTAPKRLLTELDS
jgi:predicted DNA-binding protein (MmcQ/YjbR family)